MPSRRKSYTVTKSTQQQKKRAEQVARRAYAIERKANSYLSEDEQLESWKLHLNKMGLELRDIPADGNCLFGALADQLDGSTRNHLAYRAEVCRYMADRQHDFAPFLDDTDTCFDRYLSDLRKPGTFAGNDALVAFARLHQLTVVVHQLDSASFRIEGGEGDKASRTELHLTYHNGEHYSSIRRVGDRSSSPARIKFSTAQSESPSEDENRLSQISQSTGCQDREFIAQSLKDCGGELEAAIDYINSVSLSDKVDTGSCSSTNSCPHHGELSKQGGSTSTLDSGVCTCDSKSTHSSTQGASSVSQEQEYAKPVPVKESKAKPSKRLTKAERKKEKKKRAEDKHKSNRDVNHNRDSSAPVYEVVSKVALLSV